MVSKGNHPQMAARFRLVNYYNLPRDIYIYHHGRIGSNPILAHKPIIPWWLYHIWLHPPILYIIKILYHKHVSCWLLS